MSQFRRRPPDWDDATPDDELVGWVKRGQRDAFGVLYDRYLGGVYSYCFRMLGLRETAEDANSLVFAKALGALPQYGQVHSGGSFRSWLFAIAHNVIVDELRMRRMSDCLETVDWVHDPAPLPEEQAIAEDERRTILDLLPQLSPDQGHVISLRLSGLTAVEIAAVMGRPRNAIDGIQHRALVRLRELVATGSETVNIGGEGRD